VNDGKKQMGFDQRFPYFSPRKSPPIMQHARPLIEHLLAKGKLEAAIEGSLMLCRRQKKPPLSEWPCQT